MKRDQSTHPPKAYRNLDFLASREARTIRLLAEYLEPEERFERYHVEDTVVFFGSARAEKKRPMTKKGGKSRLDAYYDDAEELAYRITEWSKGLSSSKRRFIVCSGGGPGIMQAANEGASRAAGVSVGLGISLPFEQGVNEFVSRELAFEFHYFFMRKFWFVYLAKALAIFPGGFGTFDELFEVLTLMQTGKSSRPRPIVLYGAEFWENVVDWDLLVEWGTISKEDLDLIRICGSVDEAFEHLTGRLTALHDL